MSTSTLQCGRFILPLARPLVMGIVNVTPDSFSGDGLLSDVPAAVELARRMVADGADILDVGGESTRPGAAPVPVDEELRRVLPVVAALVELQVPISVDTRHAEVMHAALAAGADMINDVNALREPGAIEAVAASRAAVCLMHMKGDPQTMQQAPVYRDVVQEVGGFLADRARAVRAAGVGAERVVIDPGFGFGKTREHNLALVRGLEALAGLGYPVLVGLSRKSVLGALTGRDVTQRLGASVGAALAAVARGARIVRVHDVRDTRDALAVWQAIEGS